MFYTIKLKTSFLGIPVTKTIKNVKFHAFPTDFNNQQFLLIIKMDESREMINLDKYKRVLFPVVAYINNNQTVKETTDLDKYTQNQKKLLKKI